MLKTIPAQDLRVGMFLQELKGSWIEHPFWRSKFLLKAQSDVVKVLDAGIAEVVIDTGRGLDVPSAAPAVTAPADLPAALEPSKALSDVGREYLAAAKLCEKSMDAVLAVFSEARLGKAVDARACLPLVEEIVDAVMTSPDTMATIARLKTIDNYTYMHAVAVSTLMICLARQLGLPAPLIREAGLAGLLHDTGKAQLPLELLAKPGRLTDLETTLMQSHALRGQKLLASGDSAGAAVLDMALHHHERADGSGYPDHLSGDKISLFARMGAVCDVYDAVTSRRPYRAPWDPGDAMRQMAQAKGKFDTAVFQSFVKSLGIYPTGSLVRLQSDALAVVIGQGSTSLLTPRVKVFYSVADRHRVDAYELDLGDKRQGDKIIGVEPPDAWRFPDLDKLWLAGSGGSGPGA